MGAVHNRRVFLQQLLFTAAALGIFPGARAGADSGSTDLRFGEARKFNFDQLVTRAEEMSREAYRPPRRPAPDVVESIRYDSHGRMTFKREYALFEDGGGVHPVTFFPLGRFFPTAVKMHALDEEGRAREILYSPDYFEIPSGDPTAELPEDAGFAGFRLHKSRHRDDWRTQDWAAFLGASYFRAIGELGQYGLSARGIAVDTAMAQAEEFPEFTEIYIEPAAAESEAVNVYALLDGPSVSGAFHFALTRGDGVLMDVDARLFLREDVDRLGIAPLNSMFWFSNYNRRFQEDWRPQVHDSDGLQLWTGDGERIWRPLNNPAEVRVSSFMDDNPRGFGLMQRDRRFESYLDGVHYERRPSLWVEPLQDWGKGSVQLVEIPTDDEIYDNIVAFWVPEEEASAGSGFSFRYRLHWLADAPYQPERLGRVSETRIGQGGEPGKPRPEDTVRFVVEFDGAAIAGLDEGAEPEAVVSASQGSVPLARVEQVPAMRRWRALFDLELTDDNAPVELRLFLRRDGETLTETWLYQYDPKAGPCPS